MKALEIKNLSKKYGPTVALDGISFSVNKGQIFGFLGPNGAGKSTTIKIIMDLLRRDTGEVTINGQDTHTASVPLKDIMGYVPAEPVLYPQWTGHEHIAFMARLRGQRVAVAAQELAQLLQFDATKKVRELSTGNLQKLAIILALAPAPDFLVLDEPTRGLDPLLRSTFHNLVRRYQSQGGTVLLSSHDLAEVEGLCDSVAIIHKGKVVKNTTIEKLRGHHHRTVKIHFSTTPPDLTKLPGVSRVSTIGHTTSFSHYGDLHPLVALLASHSVQDMEIVGASLEDVFKELYQ